MVTVRGTGWTHQVYADGVEVEISQNYGNGQLTRLTSAKSGPPDASGVFSLQMTIPADAKPGLLSISPITGGPEISDTLFTVNGGGTPSGGEHTQPTATLTPYEGPPGTVTTADGHGFIPNQSVTVTQSGGPGITGGGGTVQTDQSGSIKMNFRIADQTPPGVITVTFRQSSTIVTAQFRVTAKAAQDTGGPSPGFPNNSGGKGGSAQPGQGNLNGPTYFTVTNNGIWAGYGISGLSALPGGDPFRAGEQPFAAGSWVVPPVKCLPSPTTSAAAVWVGLGGRNAPLEQIATQSACDQLGQSQYSAFIQLTDKGQARPLTDAQGKPYPVAAGDRIVAQISYAGNGEYEFIMHSSQGWYFTKKEAGSRDKAAWNTAEWIVEAPTLGRSDRIQAVEQLANFGEVSFSGCYTRFGPISDSRHTVTKYELSQSSGMNVSKASPSSISKSNGASSDFTVKWRLL